MADPTNLVSLVIDLSDPTVLMIRIVMLVFIISIIRSNRVSILIKCWIDTIIKRMRERDSMNKRRIQKERYENAIKTLTEIKGLGQTNSSDKQHVTNVSDTLKTALEQIKKEITEPVTFWESFRENYTVLIIEKTK